MQCQRKSVRLANTGSHLFPLSLVFDDDLIPEFWLEVLFLLLFLIRELGRAAIELHLSLQLVGTGLGERIILINKTEQAITTLTLSSWVKEQHLLWLAFPCNEVRKERGIAFLSNADTQPQTANKPQCMCKHGIIMQAQNMGLFCMQIQPTYIHIALASIHTSHFDRQNVWPRWSLPFMYG